MIFTREQKRGLLERKRRKKFLYLKNTGQLDNYYKSIRRHNEKPKQNNPISIELNWFDKAVVFIEALFKTIKQWFQNKQGII